MASPSDQPPTQLSKGNTALLLRESEPPPIPDHQLLRRIGAGSYGEVWLARSVMQTYRAIKIVHQNNFTERRPFDRELAGLKRFEPVSRTHESLVDVLHVGQNEEAGFFYYVMELADDFEHGQNIHPDTYVPTTLAVLAAGRRRLPAGECLLWGIALCRGLVHLHQHGLIHRDVKPSNIIFANGAPKLADVGLVADIGEALSFVGTTGFIPPEGPGTPQSDVYSLGKVLYEITNGKDRHEFPALPEISSEFPDAPALVELNEVISKACQDDKNQRYQSAQEMLADLRVLEAGRSVYRLRVLEARFALLKKIAGLALIILVLGGLVYYPYSVRRERAADIRQREIGAQLAYGVRALEEGNLLQSIPNFVEALRLDHSDPTREEMHRRRIGSVLAQSPKLLHIWFLGKEVRDVEFSFDGKQVLTVKSFAAAQVWDSVNGEAASLPFGSGGGLVTGSFSPDGKQIVTATEEDGTADLWDATTGQRLFRLPHPGSVLCARFSPDGQWIVTGCADHQARIWNVTTRRELPIIMRHNGAILHVEFSPDGRSIVTASRDGTAQVWDAQIGEPKGPRLKHKNWVYYASFSPDGHKVVTASLDRTARIWDASTGSKIGLDMRHGKAVHSAVFSPDGRSILTASWDSTVRLWDADTGQPLARNAILQHSDQVHHAVFAPDGHRIITACVDGTVRLWDFASTLFSPAKLSGTLSADGRRIFTTRDNSVTVRNTLGGEPVFPPITVPGQLVEAALNPNGEFLLTLANRTNVTPEASQTIQVWRVAPGRALSPALPFAGDLADASVSDDGRYLFLLSGKNVRRFRAESGQELLPPLAPHQWVWNGVFSPNGEYWAALSGNQVYLWKTASGEPIGAALEHVSPVSFAAFSPDGRWLVTCTSDDQLNPCYAQLWNASTGKPQGGPLRHHDGVLRAAFSSDSRRLVTASEDSSAVAWDIATSQPVTLPLWHEDQVFDASFSHDGRRIATASRDESAGIWDMESGLPLTPPLKYYDKVWQANLLPDGTHLVIDGTNHTPWLWSLPREDRPISHLILLSQLFAPNQITKGPGIAENATAILEANWRTLHAAYPRDFQISTNQIIAWHRHESELAEANEQWFAARFHLDRLLALQPADPALREHREQVHQKMGRE